MRRRGQRLRSPVGLGLGTLVYLGCSAPPAPPAEGEPSPAVAAQPPAWPAWGGEAAPSSTAELRAAELARRSADPVVAEGLASDDPHVREAAAWSLARIDGSRALPAILGVVGGPGERRPAAVAAAAAFERPPEPEPGALPPEAAAPSGWDRIERALWTRYALAEDRPVAEAALFALSRVGGDRTVDLLADEIAAGEESPARAGAALALSLVCARGLAMTQPALDALLGALASADETLVEAALRAVARCSRSTPGRIDPETAKALARTLEPRLVDPAHPLAPLAWRALGAIGQLPETIPPYVLAAGEPIPAGGQVRWRSAVEAARALARTAGGRRELATRLGTMSIDTITLPGTHAVVEAIRGLRVAPRELGAAAGLTKLAAALERGRAGAQGRRARELAWVACELAVTLAAARPEPTDGRPMAELGPGCPRDALPAAQVAALEVEAVVRAPAGPARSARLLAWAGGDDPWAAPALAALADLSDPKVAPALRAALAAGDVGRVSAAAGAIALRAKDPRLRDPKATEPLLAAVESMRNEGAVEARVAALVALAAEAREAAEAGTPPAWLDRLLPLARDPAVAVRRAARAALAVDPARLARFEDAVPDAFPGAFAAAGDALDPGPSPPRELRLRLPGGVVRVDLRGVPAPMNQANLARLAERGFFEGVPMHRVVPGFVVQGGDPRGDGYGGPGYLVPCEWSNLRYRRGAVGMALAGKDTGGSQFFITQAATPHLDGRYTLVGYVVEGMDVVDGIMPYEAIERVEVVRGPAGGRSRSQSGRGVDPPR